MADNQSVELDKILEYLIDIDWEKDTEIRQSYLDAAKAQLSQLLIKEREKAKQEFRDKFSIDPTKKYHVVASDKAVIITEWEHYKHLQSQLKEMEK